MLGRAVKCTKRERMHNELTPVIYSGQLSEFSHMCIFDLFCCLCLSVLKKILIPLVCVSKNVNTFLKNHNAIHNIPNIISDNCLAFWKNQSMKLKASFFSHHNLIFHKENHFCFPVLLFQKEQWRNEKVIRRVITSIFNLLHMESNLCKGCMTKRDMVSICISNL